MPHPDDPIGSAGIVSAGAIWVPLDRPATLLMRGLDDQTSTSAGAPGGRGASTTTLRPMRGSASSTIRTTTPPTSYCAAAGTQMEDLTDQIRRFIPPDDTAGDV
jgi:hypothetical protein